MEIHEARDNIDLRTLPPLDAVKIPADKLQALMEKFGLDKDYPPHLQRFRKVIEEAESAVDEIVTFANLANIVEDLSYSKFAKWYDAGGMDEVESSESEKRSDTLPTAQDQILMNVDGASAVTEKPGRH
ncbi:hypothetical protein MKX01_029200 [Papaver californicum]|nr:hypothetical protein MKX01_029200 [Papaver californicum]